MLNTVKKDNTYKNFTWTKELEQDFLDIMHLFTQSEYHKTHNYVKITELVMPILALNYYFIYRENDTPKSYISWGFFGPEEEKNTFIHQTKPITIEDYNSGKQPWVVDLIAPDGHVNQVIAKFAEWGKINGYDGVIVKLIRLHKNKKRLGKFKFKASRRWL